MSSIIEAFKSRDQDKRTIARRSTLETCLDILRAIKAGSSSSTTIMYNANVSWEAMQDNLKVLGLASLVSSDGSKNRRKYQITPKGERLVASYEEIIGAITGFMNGNVETVTQPVVTYA